MLQFAHYLLLISIFHNLNSQFYCNIFILNFVGDLYDEERLLKWLTSNDVFEIENEIEEVNRKMMEKLLEDNEFVAVFFCKFYCIFT